jgi:cell wall-associated NlpC family hydrolase
LPLKPAYLFLAGGGGVLVWSGLKGKSVSSVFRQLAGGDSPASATSANSIASVTASGDLTTTTSGIVAGKAGTMLAFFEAAVGKPYTEQNPERFGPAEYDCSGLLWAAAHNAGIAIPQAAAIADLEAIWFAAQPGTTKILSASNANTGDICFFTGSDPDANSEFPPIGHVGMCSTPGTLVSAYDTQQGVCYTPMSQDHFVVGVRLAS